MAEDCSQVEVEADGEGGGFRCGGGEVREETASRGLPKRRLEIYDFCWRVAQVAGDIAAPESNTRLELESKADALLLGGPANLLLRPAQDPQEPSAGPRRRRMRSRCHYRVIFHNIVPFLKHAFEHRNERW